MRSRAVLALLVCTLAVSIAASAQTADEIATRHIEALGGKERLAAVHSAVSHGSYHEGNFTSHDAAVYRMLPYYKALHDGRDFHVDFNEGFDGSPWEFYAVPGVVLRTVGAAAAAGRHGTRIFDLLAEPPVHRKELTLVGEESVAGRPAWKLHLVLHDGFERDFLVDKQTYLISAERQSAPIHAFGANVASDTRFSDYRSVHGVLFPFAEHEVEIATGRELNSFITSSVEVNTLSDPAFFSPPQFTHTALQVFLEQLYMERTDVQSVMWSYRGFRAANPSLNTSDGVEFIGYQMLKMGDTQSAIMLLAENVADYPQRASAHFGLGRAYKTAGNLENARAQFQQAVAIDPSYSRAKSELNGLK
jgi:hypothetical protein